MGQLPEVGLLNLSLSVPINESHTLHFFCKQSDRWDLAIKPALTKPLDVSDHPHHYHGFRKTTVGSPAESHGYFPIKLVSHHTLSTTSIRRKLDSYGSALGIALGLFLFLAISQLISSKKSP